MRGFTSEIEAITELGNLTQANCNQWSLKLMQSRAYNTISDEAFDVLLNNFKKVCESENIDCTWDVPKLFNKSR